MDLILQFLSRAICGIWEAEDRPEVRPRILVGGALVIAFVFALWYALR